MEKSRWHVRFYLSYLPPVDVIFNTYYVGIYLAEPGHTTSLVYGSSARAYRLASSRSLEVHQRNSSLSHCTIPKGCKSAQILLDCRLGMGVSLNAAFSAIRRVFGRNMCLRPPLSRQCSCNNIMVAGLAASKRNLSPVRLTRSAPSMGTRSGPRDEAI